MRYIDTGTRDATQALGSWLSECVLHDQSVQELRWQSGFFDAGCLGYFSGLMQRLRTSDGVLKVLVGSNEGATERADIESLIAAAGPPRSNRQIGIVKFGNAYFHPKTIHIVRDDGSAAAYVGSANLTKSGLSSLHVEAGLLLDSAEADDSAVLAQIGAAIDWWFAAPRPGLTVIEDASKLNALVAQGILNVPPPKPAELPPRAKLASLVAPRLRPLVEIPESAAELGTTADEGEHLIFESKREPKSDPSEPPSSSSISSPAVWSKSLTRSDAQRKAAGNQRGSITLVQAGYPIDAQSYFRNAFFKAAVWVPERTRTGERREAADVRFKTRFLGNDLGTLTLRITYAPNREASQANYTSLLHLGRLAYYFGTENVIGKTLRLERDADGDFTLTIE